MMLKQLRAAEDACQAALAAERLAPDDPQAARAAEDARATCADLRDACDRLGLTPQGAW